MLRRLFALASLLALPFVAPTARAAPPDPDTIDVSSIKAKLKLVTDGKQHYLALIPFGEIDENFYYGDGKTFWLQRVFGGGQDGNQSFDKYFWDPRAHATAGASFEFRNGKYVLTCDERKTEMTPVSDAETQKILAAARFEKPRWKRQAYALLRDNNGRYYYVDKMREPEGNKAFRLFVGPKGSLKLQKMTNVVSDSAGDIFATRSGSLRLVLNQGQTFWQKGKRKTTLINLPIEDNHVLIYSELGVYTGQRLGTPCDDL